MQEKIKDTSEFISKFIIQLGLLYNVILAFWLVLAYDLLEDRCTIDVITTKFFPRVLKWQLVLRI